MKKKLSLILIILLIISIFYYKSIENKNKELHYAVEKYATSGFFNDYKLRRLDEWILEFSDGNICIVTIKGMEYKAPHDIITYKIFLEKNKKGIWKLKKYYK
ncbi:hypothetical protein ACFIJ5_03960 [Haloimpatiens sp. FM7330]|uniref:hypothetical protein n=1 Tax=Haloimpatiens sp. FM7330 TaxID=3298610 RepID=UPI00363F2A66